MKELADGHKVSSRSYYFLLDWNEANRWTYLRNIIGRDKLCSCTRKQYKKLFAFATKFELNKL